MFIRMLGVLCLACTTAFAHETRFACQADELFGDYDPTAPPHENHVKNSHGGVGLDASMDFDGDGTEDILYSGAFGGTASYPYQDAWLRLSCGKTVKFTHIPNPIKNEPTPSVAFLRDFDGDGKVDIAIGAPQAGYPDSMQDPEGKKGRVYIFLGGSFVACTEPTFPTELKCEKEPDNVGDTDAQIVIVNDSPELDWFGASLASGEFERNDETESKLACSDLAVGAPGEPNAQTTVSQLDCDPSPSRENWVNQFAHSGKVHLFLGKDLTGEPSTVIWTTSGNGTSPPISRVIFADVLNGRFGYDVAAVPNLQSAQADPLGFDELLVGAPGGRLDRLSLDPLPETPCVDAPELTGYAEVWPMYSHDPILQLSGDIPVSMPAGFPTCLQVRMFGWSVSLAGDIDGDGAQDYLIGAPGLSESYDQPPGSDCTPIVAPGNPVVHFGGVFLLDGQDGTSLTTSVPMFGGLPFMLTEADEDFGIRGDKDALGYSVAGREGFVWPFDSDNGIDAPSILVGIPNRATPIVPSVPEPPEPEPCTNWPAEWPNFGGDDSGTIRIVRVSVDPLVAIPVVTHVIIKGESGRDGLGMSVAISNRLISPGSNPFDLVMAAPRHAGDELSGIEDEAGRVYVFDTVELQP